MHNALTMNVLAITLSCAFIALGSCTAGVEAVTPSPTGSTEPPTGADGELNMNEYDGSSFEDCASGFATGGASASYYTEDPEDGGFLHRAWVDHEVEPTLWLDIEVYGEWGGLASPGSPYELGSSAGSYRNCSLCVVAYTDDAVFMPSYGIATIDSVHPNSSAVGQPFSGNLDVVLQEVEIDESTYATQVVDGGCQGRLQYEWNSTIEEFPNACTETSTDSDSFLSCAPCMGQGGVQKCYAEDYNESGEQGEAVYYSWVNRLVTPTLWLDVLIYSGNDGGESWGATAPGTYTLSSDDESYASCSFCILAFSEEKAFMPVANGTITIDAIAVGDDGQGQQFTGSLDATMQEVEVNWITGATTVVANGCTGTLDFEWDAEIGGEADGYQSVD